MKPFAIAAWAFALATWGFVAFAEGEPYQIAVALAAAMILGSEIGRGLSR